MAALARHVRTFLSLIWMHAVVALLAPPASCPRVAVVGGGISGLLVGYVLQQSGNYTVQLLEASDRVGGNILKIPDPNYPNLQLNIGHATHLGMFLNLRLMLHHLGIEECPVGEGPNSRAGMFRMMSVATDGQVFQPPVKHIISLRIWWEALVFYYHSYMQPDQRLDHFLSSKKFSKKFVDIVFWAISTFEFDKTRKEAGEYALGTARVLLITQVFFQFLLCNSFNGRLPPKIDDGLSQELEERLRECTASSKFNVVSKKLSALKPLGSYFSANYQEAAESLASGIENVRLNANVTSIRKVGDRINILTEDAQVTTADSVVLTIQPQYLVEILDRNDFRNHLAALEDIESGAVGVRIMHASDLPFLYPPLQQGSFGNCSCIPVLGIFDISQLTTTNDGVHVVDQDRQAGWLSIAFPVYRGINRHAEWLQQYPCAHEAVYPWVRATSTYPRARRKIVKMQGHRGVFITGHALTGVNKASELQIVNALNLCHEHFGVEPPWKDFFPTPMLPDCNDDDAFRKALSSFEAVRLALKSLTGSFLLAGTVSKLGSSFFD